MARKAQVQTSTPAQAREWLAANGHPEVAGKIGRMGKTLVAAFEQATGTVVRAEVKTPARKVTIKTGKTPVTLTVTPGEVRAALVASGAQVGTRGRLSTDQWQAGVALVRTARKG